jgi:NitT/TauT family transport system ATP-binding protein
LVYRPDVILMDEPFGALDAQTRMVMQEDLQMLSHAAGATVLFITHDITEAVLLADNVVPAPFPRARQYRNRPAAAARRVRAVPQSRLRCRL